MAYAVERTELCVKAKQIAARLAEKGFKAYFVGGAVRDMLLGKAPGDIDIATSAKPDEIIAFFPQTYLVGAAFGIINVVVDGHPFEVATFREERAYMDGRHPEDVKFTDSPEADAARRDFTVNALFYDPFQDKVLDFVGGIRDLKAGVLRTVGNAEDRFSEDYLRMLRAVRFAVRLGFEVSPEIPPAVRKLRGKVKELSAERISGELDKMLLGPRPDRAVRMLHELGLLREILPEVADMEGVAQPKKFHPEGDVLTHTLMMLEHIAVPDLALAWSLLLHDVGKPRTFSVDSGGVEHFYGHEAKGGEMVGNILGRLKMPRTLIDNVAAAVGSHMSFSNCAEMRPARWRRIAAAEIFPLQLELHRIDCLCSHSRMDNLVAMLDHVAELENEVKLPAPLINGNDLIAMGMKPGREFGRILKGMQDLQLEGKIKTRDEALEKVKKDCAF